VDETFPEVGSMSDEELKALIDELKAEEREISYRRRLLHGKIDLLRAELVNRLRTKHEAGDELISGNDVEALTDILLGKVETPVGEDR
jgi:anti-sigma-K factor RsiG